MKDDNLKSTRNGMGNSGLMIVPRTILHINEIISCEFWSDDHADMTNVRPL